MSQLVERLSQPEMGGAHFFQRRLEAERCQEYGWQEPYESRGSRTVLRVTGGETPPVYPTGAHGLYHKYKQRGSIVASKPLSNENWNRVKPGQLLIFSGGISIAPSPTP